MITLLEEIKHLQNSRTKSKIDNRLKDFKSLQKKSTKHWFSELCFCILAANSKGKNAWDIQEELGADALCKACATDIRRCIIEHKHRFHNNKTRFIVDARKHLDIKDKIKDIISKKGQREAREWLVKNIKGIGYKEASHFLRNVGYFHLAILDRHVLSLLEQHGIYKKPKTLNKKRYFDIEDKLQQIADKLKMSQGELDMYLWHMKTGEVLK
jgi:N-glycosylase/DNA lyase